MKLESAVSSVIYGGTIGAWMSLLNDAYMDLPDKGMIVTSMALTALWESARRAGQGCDKPDTATYTALAVTAAPVVYALADKLF